MSGPTIHRSSVLWGNWRVLRWAIGLTALALMTAGCLTAVRAHDPSTYGGLFRSRNFGETWVSADAGLFLNAALTAALDPANPNQLLLGTDTGLLRSPTGGRSWAPEARELIFGPVFAVAASPDGQTVLSSSPGGVFRRQSGAWTRSAAPAGAAPARTIVFGVERDRVYLLGPAGLFTSSDAGGTFRAVTNARAPGPGLTVMAVAKSPGELLFAVIDHTLMTSQNGGKDWHRRSGLPAAAVDMVVVDPIAPDRVFAGGSDRLYQSDDLGATWRAIGSPLPEPQTSIRGIAANLAASTLVVTTQRGLYRSVDRGSTWGVKEGTLPVHLEAGPLVRDPTEPNTLLAVYSLMPYPEVWRSAVQGGNLLAHSDWFSLVGGAALLLLLALGAGFLVAWLHRLRGSPPAPDRLAR